MEVRTLGRLRGAATYGLGSADSGPPSSQAVLALYRGEPGAIWKVILSTLLRSLLLAPGMAAGAAIGGARGWKLAGATVAGALIGSLGITGFLAAYYAIKGVPGAQQPLQTSPRPLAPEALEAQAVDQAVETSASAAAQADTAAAMAGARRQAWGTSMRGGSPFGSA